MVRRTRQMARIGKRDLHRQLTENPALQSNCQILYCGIRGFKPFRRFELCGEMMTGSEKKAREHVAFHAVSPAVVALNGVGAYGPVRIVVRLGNQLNTSARSLCTRNNTYRYT